MHIAHVEVGVVGTGIPETSGRAGHLDWSSRRRSLCGPGGNRERDRALGSMRVPGRAAELFVREQVVPLLKGRDL